MTVAKVSIKPRRVTLTADGVLTDFDFDFKIFAEGEVTVYVLDTSDVATLQTITTDYTVAFDSENETGTITFLTPPTNLYTVLMISNVDYEQSTDIPKGGGFSEPVIEKAYDLLAIQIQQLRGGLDRAVTLSDTSTLTSLTVPAPVAGKAWLWNATADGLENSVDDFNDIVTDATAAQVAAELAETNAAADLVLTNADVVSTNADVVLTNADVVLTGLDVGYAQEWAIEPEDDPVSVAAGGDNSTTFSALHWAAKAAASSAAAQSTESVTQATHGFSVGDWVYNNGTIYALADASAAATANSIGVVSAVADVNTFTLTFDGKITGLSGLTKGSLHYLSETSGQITTTAPVTVGAFVKPVLIADSTTTGFVFNQLSVEVGAAAGLPTDLNLTGQAAEDMAIFDGSNWVAKGGVEKIKAGTLSRVNTVAAGVVGYTGIGFKPSSVIFFANVTSGGRTGSMGVDDGTTGGSIRNTSQDTTDTWGNVVVRSISMLTAAGVISNGEISTFDVDGFSINWTKTGSPTGTTVVKYMAFR